jgi:hypothetical protein
MPSSQEKGSNLARTNGLSHDGESGERGCASEQEFFGWLGADFSRAAQPNGMANVILQSGHQVWLSVDSEPESLFGENLQTNKCGALCSVDAVRNNEL